MARRIPLSRSTYEHYEYGKRQPDPFKETALRNRIKTLAKKKCLPTDAMRAHCLANVVQNVQAQGE